MELENFTILVKILKLDIVSELEVYPEGTKYEIHLGGIPISTIEYLFDRPERWYQVKGRLSRVDVATIGEAIKLLLFLDN